MNAAAREVEILIDGKPVKPRKPRGPSKKTRAMLDEAREAGFTEGVNHAASRPSGLLAWMVGAFVAGFALAHWVA